jgi:multidrug efflux pump subunit AcrA (membrane-fusion protein)
MKNFIITIITFGISISLFGNAYAAKNNQEDLPKVFLENFKPINVYKYGKYYGNVRPKIQAKIYSPIAGTLEKIFIKPGAKVKKGQVIGKIKAIDVANEMRPFPLRAPIAGIISGNMPTPGQFINRHQEVLSIYQKGDYISTINVAFEDAKALSIGHPAEVTIDDIVFKGKIHSLGQNLDQYTGTVETQIIFTPKKGSVRPGIISQNLVKYDEKKSIALPRKYIHQLGTQKVVYTIEESNKKGEKNKLKAIPVEVTGRFKDLMKISTEKKEKQLKIVTKSTLKHLSDGTNVEVMNKENKSKKVIKEKKVIK